MKAGKLTEREKQVMAGVCLGRKRAAIADDLGIAISTVDAYLLRIRRKFGVGSTLEIVVFLHRENPWTPSTAE